MKRSTRTIPSQSRHWERSIIVLLTTETEKWLLLAHVEFAKEDSKTDLSELFTKILSSIVREELLDRFMYRMRVKFVVFYSERGFTPCPRLWFFFFPKWGFTPWTWENCFIFIKWGSQNFGLVSQIVLTVILWGVFIPKWRFTPWTEWFVARFRIVESCFEFDENEWIVMLSVEFWVCRSSRCSSRYSSWRERYISLNYEQKDKEQAARDLTVLVTFYEPI